MTLYAIVPMNSRGVISNQYHIYVKGHEVFEVLVEKVALSLRKNKVIIVTRPPIL